MSAIIDCSNVCRKIIINPNPDKRDKCVNEFAFYQKALSNLLMGIFPLLESVLFRYGQNKKGRSKVNKTMGRPLNTKSIFTELLR